MTTPSSPARRRPNWGIALVVLLGVNIVADLVLGRGGLTGPEVGALAVLWMAFWLLAVVTLVSALRHRRRR